MTVEQIALVALAVNAAVCAAVPVEVKKKAPMLWAVLDALAANVGHATNRLDSSAKWQKAVAAAVLCAILGSAGMTIAAKQPSSPQETSAAPMPMLLPSVAAPAVVEPAAVSPSEAASSATAVAQ